MEANKEYEIGYTAGDCCVNCKFLSQYSFKIGADNVWCVKYNEEVWIAAVCDSFEPGSGADE